MDNSSGFVTLDGLLSLNIEEVQAHLNSLQWPSHNDTNLLDIFYRKTRAIFLILTAIDAFLAQPFLVQGTEHRSQLFNLRTVLVNEHQTRLSFLSSSHGSI